MAGRLRTIGSVCLVALAAVASIAPAARGALLFEADEYPAATDGVAAEYGVFTFGGIYQFLCEETHRSGELEEASETLTLSTSFEECWWMWPVTEPPQRPSAVLVTMSECHERLDLNLLEEGESLAAYSLDCPEEQQVEIELHWGVVEICTLTVPAQEGVSHVHLENVEPEGEPTYITATSTVEGLHFTQDNALCPLKTGTYENLHYESIDSLTATGESEEQIGLSVAE